MTRILIADASARARSALRLVLEQSSCVTAVREATSCEECSEIVGGVGTDILLLDWRLPCSSVSQLVSELRSKYPRMQIVALSARPEDGSNALAAGAHVFVSKIDSPDVLLGRLAFGA